MKRKAGSMSLRRSISWSAARRDMLADRVTLPTGFLAARGYIETLARTRRPFVVAGRFDRAAIMAAATVAAKAHQGRYGSTWAEAMAVALTGAWQIAKAAQRAAVH